MRGKQHSTASIVDNTQRKHNMEIGNNGTTAKGQIRGLIQKGSESILLVELIASIIVVLLNVSQIAVISKLKVKNHFEKILLSLSFSDLLYGFTNAVLGVMQLKSLKKIHIFDIIYAIHLLCVLASIVHLAVIGLDRVWAIVQPIKHNVVM